MHQQQSPGPPAVRRRNGHAAWIGIGGALVLAVPVLLLLLLRNGSIAPSTWFGRARSVTVAEIAAAPRAVIGDTVTVSGPVGEVYGPQAFTLGGDPRYGAEAVLVVSTRLVPAASGRSTEQRLLVRDLVQVTGPVRRFDVLEFERDAGVDLDDAALAPFTGTPALLAEQLELTPYLGEVASDTEAASAGQASATVSAIIDNPDAFVGRWVLLTANVGRVLSPSTLTLSGQAAHVAQADNELLVVSAERSIRFGGVAGETLSVIGRVRRFDLAEVEREIGYQLPGDALAGWQNRPVVIATAVQSAP